MPPLTRCLSPLNVRLDQKTINNIRTSSKYEDDATFGANYIATMFCDRNPQRYPGSSTRFIIRYTNDVERTTILSNVHIGHKYITNRSINQTVSGRANDVIVKIQVGGIENFKRECRIHRQMMEWYPRNIAPLVVTYTQFQDIHVMIGSKTWVSPLNPAVIKELPTQRQWISLKDQYRSLRVGLERLRITSNPPRIDMAVQYDPRQRKEDRSPKLIITDFKFALYRSQDTTLEKFINEALAGASVQNTRTMMKKRCNASRGSCVRVVRGALKLPRSAGILAGIVPSIFDKGRTIRYALNTYARGAYASNVKFHTQVLSAARRLRNAETENQRQKIRNELFALKDRMHRNQSYHTGLTKTHINQLARGKIGLNNIPTYKSR